MCENLPNYKQACAKAIKIADCKSRGGGGFVWGGGVGGGGGGGGGWVVGGGGGGGGGGGVGLEGGERKGWVGFFFLGWRGGVWGGVFLLWGFCGGGVVFGVVVVLRGGVNSITS